MRMPNTIAVSILGLSLTGSQAGAAETRERSQIPDRYKWNLAVLAQSSSIANLRS